MTKFPWKLKYIAKYILKAFFLTTFPSTQKKMSKIYAITLVLPLNLKKHTIGDDNSHISAILQWNMNIAETFHL